MNKAILLALICGQSQIYSSFVPTLGCHKGLIPDRTVLTEPADSVC